jgi:hypothetical protein
MSIKTLLGIPIPTQSFTSYFIHIQMNVVKRTSFYIFMLLVGVTIFQKVDCQVLVNKETLEGFGTPSSILETFGMPFTELEWASSKISDQAIFTTGHTVTGEDKVSILTTKQSAEGDVIWQRTYVPSGQSIYKSYGIDIDVDNIGNTYVVGALTLTNQYSFDIVVLKYDSLGTLLWESTFNGPGNGPDLPTDLVLDSNGDPYLTGTSTGVNTGLDYLTLRLNPSNGNIVWRRTYDHNSFDDIAIKLVIDQFGKVAVAGASASSITDWDIANLAYGKTLGNLIAETRVSDAGIEIESPTSLTSDGNGNFYIAGNTKIGTENQDIQIIKLDTQFNIQWTISYDDGLNRDDGVNGMLSDDEGNIFVLGSSKNSVGNAGLKLLKYDSLGNLIWVSERLSEGNNIQVKGYKLAINENNEIYAAGQYIVSSEVKTIVMKFDKQGNVLWGITRENEVGEDTYPVGLGVNQENTVFVFLLSLNENGEDSRYRILKLDEFNRNNNYVLDSTGIPRHYSHQAIVKFDRRKLKQDNVNNLDIVHADPSFFLNTTGIEALSTILDTSKTKFIRIFRCLPPNLTKTISRQRDTVRVEDFWSVFLLSIDDTTKMDPFVLSDSLETLTGTVIYAHPNLIGQLSTNGTSTCSTNDIEYSLQQSLQATNPLYLNGDIEVEGAWCIETGKEFVRVGVFDNYLWWHHEDFGYDGSDPESTVVAGGWRFELNQPLKTSTNQTAGAPHATPVAGIIGAVRNNELSVAGIAGGDHTTSERGVSLYGMEIFRSQPTDLAMIADAWVTSAIQDESLCYGYGLHIMNNSFNLKDIYSDFSDDLQLASDAIEQVNRLGVSFFGSRGNISSDAPTIPAGVPEYEDSWVMSVAGVTENGNTYSGSFGVDVDFSGPAENENQRVLIENNNTGTFSGTSAACPHAAGIAALLLSYYNSPEPNCKNLAPEDVEWILQESATDIDDLISGPGVDDYTGYGLVQADAAISLITAPERELLHFDTWAGCNIISGSFNGANDPVEEDITIELLEPFESLDFLAQYTPGTYTADVYRFEVDINNTIPSNYNILGYWPRHSASNTLIYYTEENGVKQLRPHHFAYLDQLNNSGGLIGGYHYHLKDTNGNSLGWIPFDPQGPLAFAYIEFAYSVLVEDNTIINVEEEDSRLQTTGPKIELWPNPSNEEISFKFIPVSNMKSDIDLNIYDATGALIQSMNVNAFTGIIDIRRFSPGLYFCQITTEKGVYSKSFVKM